MHFVSHDSELSDSDSDVAFVKMLNVLVNGVCSKNNKPIYCEMHVNSKPIKLQVDCGATVCIIPKSLIGEIQIESRNVSLEMWNKVKMKAIAQNFTTRPGLFLSLVALSLKSCESKDTKQ